MRLSIQKSKNHVFLYIVKDFYSKGKRTTKIIDKLGTVSSLMLHLNLSYDEVILWARQKAKDLTLNESHVSNKIILSFSANSLLPINDIRAFNCGYLFLQSLLYQMKIANIFRNISSKQKCLFHLESIFTDLVYSRILHPSSKRSSFAFSYSFLEPPKYQLEDVYRSLSIFSKMSDYILSELYKNSNFLHNRNVSTLYYDCTNYYFEIEQEDGFKKYGKGKEHRPNPIVGMGLFMDGDSLPLSCNIYPGNQNEQKTLIPEEDKIVNNFKLDTTKIILCTDAGLASDEIKKFNIQDGRGFVITQSLKKLKEEEKCKSLDKSEWRIANDLKHIYNLETIENDETLREKYYDTLFYKIIPSETKSVKQDLIITFSFKYLDYHRNIRNNQIERARKNIENNQVTRKGKNQNDYRRFITSITSTDNGEVADNTTYSINESLILEEEQYDGYYALTTNLMEDISSILKIVKGRWEIEESFRIMKHDFLARPVELSREDRIKAHFMTCFISLFIYRLLEKKLDYKYTTSKILTTLRNMNVLEHKGLGYEPEYERTALTDDLHDLFKFNTDYEIISYKKMKKIFNSIL